MKKRYLTPEDWIKAGYRKFEGGSCRLNNSDFGLQKLIDDKKGERYYITVSVYDWNKYPAHRDGGRYGYSPEVQFRETKDFPTVNLTVWERESVTEVEKVVDHIWKSVGKPYYDLYEPDKKTKRSKKK